MLKDKVAVIYGGGGAVGLAIARAFAREGACVFLTGRNLSKVEAVAKGISDAGGKAEAAQVNALDEHAVDGHLQSVIDKAGRIDLSFNAVGIPNTLLQGVPLLDLDGSISAVAALLESSTASINSALQRARETLAAHYPGGRPQNTLRANPAQQRLLDRYLDAWQRHNVNSFVALLKEDATVTMPPWREWFVGRDAIGSFFEPPGKSATAFAWFPLERTASPPSLPMS